ncbi:hypothetical protein IEO21_11022 [Rhodonia placenta]|uniref:Uncharacterized protein n=1 Tax=Rhodonia placenta TaxID=104341 RepID=A0A8H7NRH0_9APHY|nr:hypothetical protein IEO21_11022 [Postia placenta]
MIFGPCASMSTGGPARALTMTDAGQTRSAVNAPWRVKRRSLPVTAKQPAAHARHGALCRGAATTSGADRARSAGNDHQRKHRERVRRTWKSEVRAC